MKDWDRVCREKSWKRLLPLDNFAAHTCQRTLTNDVVEKFDPNMTSHAKLMDAGIIACFKAYDKALFHRQEISRYDNKVPVDSIFGIKYLEAMRLTEIGWNTVPEATLANCIRKIGILPDETYSSAITESESPLDFIKESIEGLDTLGLLALTQRSSASDLLNPCYEHDNIISATTDEAIVRVFKEAHV